MTAAKTLGCHRAACLAVALCRRMIYTDSTEQALPDPGGACRCDHWEGKD